MRTLPVLIAGAALALGSATVASAKEIAAVQACGADGCRDVTALATHAALDGGPTTSAPERAAPFFRLEVTFRHDTAQRPSWTYVYVPSAQKIRGDDGTWMSPATTTLQELDQLVRGSAPLPAAGLGLPLPVRPSPPPSGGDGLPPAAWAFLAAGALGLLAAAAGAARTLRRRAAAPAG